MLHCFIYRIFVETSWKINLTQRIEEIRLDPLSYEAYKEDLLTFCRKKFQLGDELKKVKLLKKSLDARKRDIKYNLRLALIFNESEEEAFSTYGQIIPMGESTCHIIGFGPAGIFAAIECIRLGIKPIVIERGKAVKDRRRDVAKLNRSGEMDPESNYCYGEGGAGTFSDGKLYTRSHKRGKIIDILRILVEHGADDSILIEAHPHIGTNKLPGIIENLRNGIIEHGGEVRFGTKLTDIEIQEGRVKAIELNGQQEEVEDLILATGHSARDIYYLLHDKRVALEAKPFAMGFRIEHPQELVDNIQYHSNKRLIEALPPASYSIVEQVKGKGVFSFCMCPGGIIAPAATDNFEVVVNGWSPSKRNGQFANSGWVTEIGEEEWSEFSDEGPLAGLKFQESIENKAFKMGGGEFKVPAQNLKDYIEGKPSGMLNESSYHPGMTSANLNQLYPERINHRLREGLKQACKKLKGFAHEDAIVVAPESRTSSPVRIPRQKDMQHVDVKGLYPCAEGAGYAGGIISAALDGVRVAHAIAKNKLANQ